MLRKSSHGWRIKQEMAAVRMPSPRLNPVRERPGSPARSTPLSSLSPLPPLFFSCQKNVPPTSHFCFSRQTAIFPLSTGSVATGLSATSCYSNAPELDPHSPDDFTHVEGPNPYVDSLRESSVGIDDRREDDGEGFGRRRTLPEELSSTVVVLTCISIDGTCDVLLLRQGLSREQVPVVSCLKPEEPYLQLWSLDVDTFESLMHNSKAAVNKLEVCRGHELRVAFGEAMKYGGKVANELEDYSGYEFCVAKDDCTPRDLTLAMTLQLSTKFLVSALYGVELNWDNEDEDDEDVVDEDDEDVVDEDDEDLVDVGDYVDDLLSQFEILVRK